MFLDEYLKAAFGLVLVDGILTSLENQCVLSGCSLSVLSASIFGDRLKKLVSAVDQQLLLDENQRV